MFAKARACGRARTCSRASQMTAAAVAAAATAAITVTAVTAAAAASPTRYERTLRNCARDLSDFAGCTEGAIWDEERFRQWAREHRCEATKQAGRFVARLLRDKAANQSVGYSARLYVAAWKGYGVSVEQSVLDELSRLTREKWLFRVARVAPCSPGPCHLGRASDAVRRAPDAVRRRRDGAVLIWPVLPLQPSNGSVGRGRQR